MTQKPPINNINSIEEGLLHAEKHCQLNGSKLTRKRKQVLSILLDVEKAISAYKLIDLFKENFNEKMPPMSAYRTLDYLVSVNLVHKIHVANKFVACTYTGCQESHNTAQLLFCQECEHVQEIPITPSVYKNFTDEIKNSGNQLCSQQIELTCICNVCSDNTQTPQQSIPLMSQG